MAAEKKENHMTVGGLAEAAQVGLGTIRYYQKLGLLPTPPRTALGGPRRYSQNSLDLLLLIRNSQALGFSLKEIAEILSHWDRKDCHSARELIAEKKQAIRNQIFVHETGLKRLKKLVDACCGACGQGECQLFQSLINENLQLEG